MPQATAVFTESVYPFGNDDTERHQIKFGQIAVSASPATYTTNGLPISYANAESIKSGLPALSPPLVLSPPQPTCPIWGDIVGLSGANTYAFDPVHGTLRIYVSGTEATGGAAIPAGVSGDTIVARLEFNLDI